MILICIWDETIYVLFVGGTEGLFARRTLEITDDILSTYKNQGKLYCCFILPEYNSVCRQVVGVPVTLNGDLKNQFVETDVGFDTICKVLMHFCELYFNRIDKLTIHSLKIASVNSFPRLIRNSSVMFVRMPFLRRRWVRLRASSLLMDDMYRNPGPVQFEGPGADAKSISLCVEDQDYMGRIKLLQEYLDKVPITFSVKSIVKPGCSQDVLKAALSAMGSVTDVLALMSSSSMNGQTPL
ncbi:hypothetical protein B296_00020848 [Ensete ventricosum]|uniref:Uncharacterized protein n=1 Tax=Ensete ventricosum TaxID=4639 RepID=A0A426Z776_ENSVE|nr:hypothetical protein B296_00020848 [Ensete ventricosum]